MTTFTCPLAAVEEAAYLALMTDRSYCVVSHGKGYQVISRGNAHYNSIPALETCYPFDGGDYE